MRFRSLLAAGVGAVGLAATGNRVLSRRVDSLEPALAGDQHTYRWRGLDVAYTDAGDPDAQDVVLFHDVGVAGSSDEFTRLVDDLAADYHVIAPDLPGFGRSDRPALVYAGSLYESFVADFLRDVATDPVCVAPGLTAAYVVTAAPRASPTHLVLVCPTARTREESRPFLRTLLRAPLVGTTLFNVLASKPSIRRTNVDHAHADTGALDAEVVDRQWRTAHQPGARFAPASYLSGHLDVDVDLGAALAALDCPTTLVWGREADDPPLDEGHRLAEEANAKLVVVDRSKLRPHVEHPAAFLDVVRDELVEAERR